MQIFTNFLPKDVANLKEKVFLSCEFPWFYYETSVDNQQEFDNSYVHVPVFRHAFYLNGQKNSNFIEILNPLLEGISNLFGTVHYASVYANLQLPNQYEKESLGFPHVDKQYEPDDYELYDTYTGIYYVNNSHGDTVLFNERCSPTVTVKPIVKDVFISPEKNKLVLWDSRIFHSAPANVSLPRVVININFVTKKGAGDENTHRSTQG